MTTASDEATRGLLAQLGTAALTHAKLSAEAPEKFPPGPALEPQSPGEVPHYNDPMLGARVAREHAQAALALTQAYATLSSRDRNGRRP